MRILLLQTNDGGLDDILFDDGIKDMPLYVYVDDNFLFLFSFLFSISCWRGIAKISLLVVGSLETH